MTEAREIPFGRPWITDEDRGAVFEVLKGHILTHGPQCKAFEEEFGASLGEAAYCVSVSSGMAALHLAYLHLGIGPGDEVIVPAQTHVATVHAVEWVGARPVFVDCDAATGNLTAEAIEAAVTSQTKAIGLVHFVGIPCAMGEIMDLAGRRGLKVVEDCALALGARHGQTHVGLFGGAACFSFYPVKHITTGEGGMFVSRHREAAEAVARLRAFGVDRTHAERAVPGLYDVPILGLNYRMSEAAAALGRAQLRRLPEILERRRANFGRLREAIAGRPGVRILATSDAAAEPSPYCLSAVLEASLAQRRRSVVEQLNSEGVGTSIYYPHPVPRLSYYKHKYGYRPADFPSASAISDASIALPVGPHLDPSDPARIGQSLRRATDER